MDKIIGYSLATIIMTSTYMGLVVAYPIAVGVKAGIHFTTEFKRAFEVAYNERS